MLIIMNDLSSDLSSPPAKFQPPNTFILLKNLWFTREYCSSFHMFGCDIIQHWLHYNAPSDSAFCHVCMVAEFENKLFGSTSEDPSLIRTGYENKCLQPLKCI